MRRFVFLALLSTAWAVLEIQLGTFLQTLTLPFKGAVMTCLAMIFIYAGRYFTHIRGSVLLMAVVVAFLKFMFSGGIAFYAVIGISVESLIIELTLWKSSPPKQAYLSAGALSVGYTLFHPALTHGLLAGKNVFRVYTGLLLAGADLLAVSPVWMIAGFTVLLVLHLLTGAVIAWIIMRLLVKLQELGIVDFRGEKNSEKDR